MAAESPRNFTRLAIAIMVAALVVSASIIFVETNKTTTVPLNIVGTTTVGSTTTFVTTSTLTVTGGISVTNPLDGYCYFAGNQSNPLSTFNIEVDYSGQWNATVAGYTYGATAPTFTACFEGSGNGVISINGWVQNPTGGQTLNATIYKDGGSNSNLTATLGGMVRSTTAPYGSVTVFAIAVP